MAPPLTPADLAALTKVQARVKGWALRNKMRLARLEEAAAAGGPHAVFSLSPKDCGRLRDVFPCGLRTVSACGTLYVFDKHLAYHSEAAPAACSPRAGRGEDVRSPVVRRARLRERSTSASRAFW